MATTRRLTPDDLALFELNIDDYEILDGELWERKSVGRIHGRVGFDLGLRIGNFVQPRKLGELYSSDTSFIITAHPLSVLRPDVAFVRTDRLPPGSEESGFYAVVPDLVVDVLSPSNRQADIFAKIERYRQAGVRLIWLVDPRTRSISVYAAGQDPFTVGDGDELDGGDVLPGFRLAVGDIFR